VPDTERAPLASVSIVAIGSFNPAIFQPLWFSTNGLIRPEEAASATINLITNDVTAFRTEWFAVQVLSESSIFETKDPTKARPLRDLVVGTFTILEHTPVKAFGFNSQKHFRMGSEEEWHAFGDHFAPRESWKAVVSQPGMRVLGILGRRDGCKASAMNIIVQPSAPPHPGVLIHVNQHYDLLEAKKASQADLNAYLLEILRDEWDGFLEYCDRTEQHLLSAYKPKE